MRIQDSALIAAATLSDRYIADRFLPDKAIDLIDEAASRLRIEIDSLPTEIDEVDRRVMQLEIELTSLAKETDEASAERREAIERELAEQRERSAGDEGAVAEREGGDQGDLATSRSSSRRRAWRPSAPSAPPTSQRAAELRYGEIPELEQRARRAARRPRPERRRAPARSSSRRRSTPTTSPRSSRAGPASRSAACSRARPRSSIHMEERLHERVVGQDEAVEAVATALRRSRAGLQDPDRPIGSFLFLGPTGVGKTELARALAEFMFDTQDAMVRIDMSEYMEKHTVSRLVGAPPGYVGYDEGGQLTEAVRRRPYCGRAARRDREGPPRRLQRAAAGARRRAPDRRPGPHGRLQEHRADHDLEHPVRRRIGVATRARRRCSSTSSPSSSTASTTSSSFDPLTREQLGEIVELQLRRVIERLAERGVTLDAHRRGRELLGNLGYDPVYGARPLRRVIQKQLVDRLALGLLDGRDPQRRRRHVDAVDGELALEKAR